MGTKSASIIDNITYEHLHQYLVEKEIFHENEMKYVKFFWQVERSANRRIPLTNELLNNIGRRGSSALRHFKGTYLTEDNPILILNQNYFKDTKHVKTYGQKKGEYYHLNKDGYLALLLNYAKGKERRIVVKYVENIHDNPFYSLDLDPTKEKSNIFKLHEEIIKMKDEQREIFSIIRNISSQEDLTIIFVKALSTDNAAIINELVMHDKLNAYNCFLKCIHLRRYKFAISTLNHPNINIESVLRFCMNQRYLFSFNKIVNKDKYSLQKALLSHKNLDPIRIHNIAIESGNFSFASSYAKQYFTVETVEYA